MKLSIVTPVYNEAKNIKPLLSELKAVLTRLKQKYEIIAVNDGSSDDSLKILMQAAKKDKHIKVIGFFRNVGQTSALLAGIDHAKGEIIITMDSDLENDPKDIPRLLKKIEAGNDVVSGWRKKRWKGKWLTRKLPSITANWLISTITGVKLHDYGCILKAYRREVIAGVRLYGEMHRFIPAYASWHGAKVAEITVNYRPRRYGVSNYGLSRSYRVILDLIVIRFLDRYQDRPMHFFGGIGFVSLFIGVLAGIIAVVLKLMDIKDFVETPLLIFSALFLIVGVQLTVMGILGEMLMRIYYESQNKKPYGIREKINF